MSDEKNRLPSHMSISDEHRPQKVQKKSFPDRHMFGASVFSQKVFHRDNSLYLKFIAENGNAVVFTRPMQLGKTTLFSLAQELFSKNTTAPDYRLEYMADEEDRNSWFVLYLDFGSVTSASSDDWQSMGRELDDAVHRVIARAMFVLLHENADLKEIFTDVDKTPLLEQGTPDLVSNLATAIKALKGSLLILVDEYDQPVREALLRFAPSHSSGLYAQAKTELKTVFKHYFSFFRAVKPILRLIKSKIWLTGITPISIREMSGLLVKDLTFTKEMNDAVGLREADVKIMLQEVHAHQAFKDGEEIARVLKAIAFHYNNLRFLGSPLYHTALVNETMRELSNSESRKIWLRNLDDLPPGLQREFVPSSVYNILATARNLRPIINRLVEDGQLLDYVLNRTLKLEDLLKEDISADDYLTLLVHVGVVSVQSQTNGYCFKVAGSAYRRDLLLPLLGCLKSSLVSLLALPNKADIYDQGEEILKDFVSSISTNSMAKLIVWASKSTQNNIMELQFQGHMVSEAHRILDGTAETTQEDVLPGKRTDITLSGAHSVIILELKQLPGGAGPTRIQMNNYSKQLCGYVKARRTMELQGKRRPVAGFVVVMYDSGRSYVVEKLPNDT
jgi:hypothetical protein